MHLVAREGEAVREGAASHGASTLAPRQHRLDIEQAEAGASPGGPSMPSGSAMRRPSIW